MLGQPTGRGVLLVSKDLVPLAPSLLLHLLYCAVSEHMKKQLLHNICSVPIASYFCSWKASGITLLPSHTQTKRVYHKKEPLLKSVRFTFAPSLKILISSSSIKFQLIQFHLIIEFLLLPDLRSTILSKSIKKKI